MVADCYRLDDYYCCWGIYHTNVIFLFVCLFFFVQSCAIMIYEEWNETLNYVIFLEMKKLKPIPLYKACSFAHFSVFFCMTVQ